MLKTRIKTHNFEDWIFTWLDFEKKLAIFKDFDPRNVVEINNYIGENLYEIEIIINKRK
jgi:hypothetical protein